MPTPAADADEVLFRQIGPGGNPIYFDPARNPPVHQSRFLPTDQDTDGLSMIRGRFRSEVWAAYRPEQPEKRFRLAVLRTDAITRLASNLGFQSLTLNPSEDSLDRRFGEPLAHCVVAEINRTDYDGGVELKVMIKEWAMAVSRTLATGDVIGPFVEPTQEPYRP
jgi:hypothetical protein